MDFLNSLNKNKTSEQSATSQHSSGGGGFMDKINNGLGGGQSGEKKEGVDWVQEHVLGQGPQTNESALEQAKDEQISDAIRRGYKSTTGKEFPVADKS
ncbi:hypothetical protein EV714DRAFT_244777 [Schizophyllum commune]